MVLFPKRSITPESGGGKSKQEDFLLRAYDYELPPAQIAQVPCQTRDASRLLVMQEAGALESRDFRDLLTLLPPGALLVMNDTRVIPARLFARKETGGGVELLRVHDPRLPEHQGRFLCRGARLKRPGSRLFFSHESATLIGREDDGAVILSLDEGASFAELQRSEGQLPLPPYIERPDGPSKDDHARYQTVYARASGAVAAPTAGLHFSRDFLSELHSRQVDTAFITLHVGPGTFQPVRNQDIRQHKIHPEWAQIPAETAERIRAAKQRGQQVIAVGTTVVRTLEGAANRSQNMGETGDRFYPEDLVILPGHRFRVVDGLITNFHLPKSSLMMLVAAMVGRKRLLKAYDFALKEGFRFYSYGDAMFIPKAEHGG